MKPTTPTPEEFLMENKVPVYEDKDDFYWALPVTKLEEYKNLILKEIIEEYKEYKVDAPRQFQDGYVFAQDEIIEILKERIK